MEIKISNKVIGESQPCFIIAEIGMNHNGDINLAREIIKSAKDCGVDAVKFQMFTAEKLVTSNAKTPRPPRPSPLTSNVRQSPPGPIWASDKVGVSST